MSSTDQSSGKIWGKFKSSTKSLSSSFSHLSIRAEHDGDSPSSTLIHKALVQYYTKQEVFQGFPEWLGSKNEVPDEQAIFKSQNLQHNPITGINASTYVSPMSVNQSLDIKRTAGMVFQKIYNTANTDQGASSNLKPNTKQNLYTTRANSAISTSSQLMKERLRRSTSTRGTPF